MLLGVPVSAGFADKAAARVSAQLWKAGFEEAMLAALACEDVLAADETPVNVLDAAAPAPAGEESCEAVFRDVQRERGGVIAGERVRDMKGPRWRLPGGAGCSWCRRGAHSADMTSLTAARAADWSTIFLPVT